MVYLKCLTHTNWLCITRCSADAMTVEAIEEKERHQQWLWSSKENEHFLLQLYGLFNYSWFIASRIIKCIYIFRN